MSASNLCLLDWETTPHAVVEYLTREASHSSGKKRSIPSMAKALPIKNRKAIAPGGTRSTFDSSVAGGVANPTEAQTSTNRSSSRGIPSTSVPTTDSTGNTSEPFSRGLLPVTHKHARTSYIQQAISPGDILLEELSQDKLHKVRIFSSQKMPQPFLDR